jgi:hypothetical protein
LEGAAFVPPLSLMEKLLKEILKEIRKANRRLDNIEDLLSQQEVDEEPEENVNQLLDGGTHNG